jgi:hypothetical protein
MQLCSPTERLFVWETAPIIRKEKSIKELQLLGLMFFILLLCGLYKSFF